MCSKICGSIVLFCTLLKQNTAFTHVNTRTAPHAMPPKKRPAKPAPASPVQDTEGVRPQPESTISGDGGPLSSPFGASIGSESSVSPQKESRRRRQPSTKREADAGTEGSSWPRHSAAGALSFAQVSSGRVAQEKRPLPLITGPAAPSATAAKAKASLKAASAPSEKGKTQSPRDAAAGSAHDQQTQDAAGQDAAPSLLFQVSTGTCHVCGEHVLCVYCQSHWHCGAMET